MSDMFFASAEFTEDNAPKPVTINDTIVTIGDEAFNVRIIREFPAIYELTSCNNGSVVVIHASMQSGLIELSLNGYSYPIRLLNETQNHFSTILKSGNDSAKSVVKLNAPMPGLLKEINIAEGQIVRKGEPLFILEAMKMENAIKSPSSGTILKIPVTAGNAVEKGALLCSINPG